LWARRSPPLPNFLKPGRPFVVLPFPAIPPFSIKHLKDLAKNGPPVAWIASIDKLDFPSGGESPFENR